MLSKIRNAMKLRESNDVGATATEYMILLVLVAVFAIGAWKAFGDKLRDKLFDTTETVDNVLGEGVDNAEDD